MDDCCNTDNFMVARTGEQLHDGRVHPYPAGNCRYRGTGQRYSGPQSFVACVSQIVIT